MAFTKFLKSLTLTCLIFLGSLVLTVCLVPFLLLVIAPLTFYRWAVFNMAKYFKPNLSKMLDARSSLFAAEDLYDTSATTLGLALQLDGIPTREQLAWTIETNCVNVKNPQNGQLLFPEMRQNIVTWMGHPFWAPIQGFNVLNQVRLYTQPTKNGDEISKPITYNELDSYLKDCYQQPWSRDKALWEFIIFPNVILKKPENYSKIVRSVVLFRIHHSLADGYSIANILSRIMKVDPKVMARMAQPRPLQGKPSQLQRLLKQCKFVLTIPYGMVGAMYHLRDFNCWKLSESQLRSGRTFSGATDKIPLSYMKEVKSRHGVSLTAVLMAMITAGMRSTLGRLTGKIPSKVTMFLPLPLPGHPEKLRNFMTLGYVTLPTGEPDPIKRLKIIHKNFEKMRKSSFPFIAAYFPLFYSVLPKFIVTELKKVNTTAFVTNFPSPTEKVKFAGFLLEETFMGGSMYPGTCPIQTTFNTYDGHGRITGGSFDSILPTQEDADDLLDSFLRELDTLAQYGQV